MGFASYYSLLIGKFALLEASCRSCRKYVSGSIAGIVPHYRDGIYSLVVLQEGEPFPAKQIQLFLAIITVARKLFLLIFFSLVVTL